MSVTSRDLPPRRDDDRPRPARGAAVVSRDRLARQQLLVERMAALSLLLVSFIGSALLYTLIADARTRGELED